MSSYYILYAPNEYTDGADSIDADTDLAVYAGPVLDFSFAQMLARTCDESRHTESMLVRVDR